MVLRKSSVMPGTCRWSGQQKTQGTVVKLKGRVIIRAERGPTRFRHRLLASMPEDLLAGRYRILSPLGSGGMGEVFLAEDTRLERRVAVKLLPASIEADAVARERLRREALAAAALDHPFICKIYEIGDAGGRVFIVMEYIEGETLHASSRGTLLPLRQVIDIAHELAQALDAAHRRGVVHRDLKPANVMVTTQGHVKVMDFGLAKQVGTYASSPGEKHGSGGGAAATTGAALTDAGTRVGTPAYMSPEQILGASLDPRSDLFSLGVMLHELATGRHPFLREDVADTMAAILRDPHRLRRAHGRRIASEQHRFREPVVSRVLEVIAAERDAVVIDQHDLGLFAVAVFVDRDTRGEQARIVGRRSDPCEFGGHLAQQRTRDCAGGQSRAR